MYIHNIDKSVIVEVSECEEAIKLIKQMTTMFDERFYVSRKEIQQDVWALNYDH